jgi:hypothetical protein
MCAIHQARLLQPSRRIDKCVRLTLTHYGRYFRQSRIRRSLVRYEQPIVAAIDSIKHSVTVVVVVVEEEEQLATHSS